jgi:hypothetical protein
MPRGLEESMSEAAEPFIPNQSINDARNEMLAALPEPC